MEDHTVPLLDLSHAGPDIISIVVSSMPLRERFICALVCKAWAEAATATTHSIILEHRMQDFSGLQHWLEKHGQGLEVLQLHAGYNAALTALPCCAKLQDLLLQGFSHEPVSMANRTWADIASATKLTSMSLKFVQTASQQADVVAALTALPNLEQLTWQFVSCSGKQPLSNSLLLQQMTWLTFLDLGCVTAAALQHLGSLTKLQHLSISAAYDWAAAGCPGLQELKALTSLYLVDLPSGVSQPSALQQLEVHRATPTALNQWQVLTGLTHLYVWELTGFSPETPPLQLPSLQRLELFGYAEDFTIPMSFLSSCTQLQFLRLLGFWLKGPGSLVASTMLQHLELDDCRIAAADGAADPVSWQQVFPGPGRLPHLTSLGLFTVQPALQQADTDNLVACCSSLQVLHLNALQDSLSCAGEQLSCAPALTRLPGLTSLQLRSANDEQCSTMVQLTGLRQVNVRHAWELSAVGLRQLAALQQLTSLGFGELFCSELDRVAQHLMKDDMAGYAYAIINKVCTHAEVELATPCRWYGCHGCGSSSPNKGGGGSMHAGWLHWRCVRVGGRGWLIIMVWLASFTEGTQSPTLLTPCIHTVKPSCQRGYLLRHLVEHHYHNACCLPRGIGSAQYVVSMIYSARHFITSCREMPLQSDLCDSAHDLLAPAPGCIAGTEWLSP